MRPLFSTLALLVMGSLLGSPAAAADQGACATDVFTIKIDPRDHRVLYAGTDRDGLLRSTDGGASWTPLIEPRVESVSALLFDPTDNTSIYGATLEEYLFKSPDGGATWKRQSSGLVPPPCGPFPCINRPEFQALAVDPGTHSTVYALASSVYRSRNGGATWDEVEFAPSGWQGYASAILVVPPPESAIYVAAGFSQYSIFRSTDRGATWSATSQAPPTEVFTLAVDPSNPGVLYARTTRGVYKSVDRGENWRPSSAGLPIQPTSDFQVRDLTADQNEPGTLFASADYYRIFKSTDHGESWVSSQRGLERERVNATAIDPWHSSIVYSATWSGVFRSTDAGANWQRSFAQGTTPIILGTQPAGSWGSSDGSSGTFLTVIGKGLDAGSVLSFNDSPRRTNRFSCTRLFVTLPSDDTARPGIAWLTVTNSDGTRSDPFPFVIEPAIPNQVVNPGDAPRVTPHLVQPRR